MSLATLQIDDFSGGLNTIDPDAELKPNEFNTFYNVELIGKGKSIRARRGVSEFTPSAALPNSSPFNAADLITSVRLFRLDQNAPDKIIYSNGRGLIGTLDTNLPANTNTTVLAAAATAEYEFLQAQDTTSVEYVWCLNGVSTPQKYRISTGVLSAWAGTPPNGTMERVWKNRMIISGVAAQPQRLYYSDIANPESWPANNFIDIKSTDDEEDSIIALEVIGENLLVFKQNSTWLVFDPVSFDNRRIVEVGCIFRSAVARLNDRVYWVARNGVYSTDGEDSQKESRNLNFNFTDSNRIYTNLVRTYDDCIVVINHQALSNTYVMYTSITRADGQHPWAAFDLLNSHKFTALVNLRHTNHFAGVAAVMGFVGFMFDGFNKVHRVADVYVTNKKVDDLNGVQSDVFGQIVTGVMNMEEVENIERLRRVMVYSSRGFDGTATIALAVSVDRVGFFFAPAAAVVPLSGYLRFRPETRGRFHQVRVTMNKLADLYRIEVKYRGSQREDH